MPFRKIILIEDILNWIDISSSEDIGVWVSGEMHDSSLEVTDPEIQSSISQELYILTGLQDR